MEVGLSYMEKDNFRRSLPLKSPRYFRFHICSSRMRVCKILNWFRFFWIKLIIDIMLGYMLVDENARIREQIIHHYIHKLLWCFLYFSRPIDVFFSSTLVAAQSQPQPQSSPSLPHTHCVILQSRDFVLPSECSTYVRVLCCV